MKQKNWNRINATVEKVGYKTVIHKEFKMPDDTINNFTTWGREGSNNAGVIALTEDNFVIIARQFRPGPEIVMDEIPGGSVEQGEDIEVAAKRELLEETGYTPKGSMKYLGKALRDAYSNEASHYFLALDCALTGKQKLDDSEHVEVAIISIEQFIENAKNAKMTDTVAVLLGYEMLKELSK